MGCTNPRYHFLQNYLRGQALPWVSKSQDSDTGILPHRGLKFLKIIATLQHWDAQKYVKIYHLKMKPLKNNHVGHCLSSVGQCPTSVYIICNDNHLFHWVEYILVRRCLTRVRHLSHTIYSAISMCYALALFCPKIPSGRWVWDKIERNSCPPPCTIFLSIFAIGGFG